MHLTNTVVTLSNINEMSHVIIKENWVPDKERDKLQSEMLNWKSLF